MQLPQQQLNYLDNNTEEGRHRNFTLSNYINSVEQMNKKTAEEYRKRLTVFSDYVRQRYGYTLDILVEKLVKFTEGTSPYEVLSSYVTYLNRKGTVSSLTLKQRVVTAKNFLEACDIEISPRKFNLKVKFPKIIRKNKEALTKEIIIDILNGCGDIRLKAYVTLLASTGLRATEALSTRICDYHLCETENPPSVFIRGEYTKTKSDRTVFLTMEAAKQLKNWLEFKYRTRRISYYDKTTGQAKCEHRTPDRNNDKELIFSIRESAKGYAYVSPDSLYKGLSEAFGKTLDRIGKGEREDSKFGGGRRKITLHSFRRYVKSTISDLGYADYSEYYIGHAGSTYYRKTDKEKAELYKKIEPYLTFLDPATLERRGSDMQTKIEEFELVNQMLRQRNITYADQLAVMEDKVNTMQSMVEGLISGLSKVKNQGQINQTAELLYGSGILKKVEP